MSILEYNGGSVLAMKGKGCVGIACDLRFGIQAQTLANDFTKVFRVHDQCMVGLAGLASDVQTVHNRLDFHHNMYKLREERDMKPSVFASYVATVLYEKRFGPYFVEPVVAGLEPDGTPFITAMDLIGAPVLASDFVVSGTSSESLYGMCETLYKPDQEPEDLFEVLSQCLLAALNRDSMSGWGAVVHVITADQVITRTLKTRQD
eukprot:TRINITY_DN9104_c0_g1_i1.p2 TRINITY_DN9104_c0_g1~~TRINITY_DN9104_c0_g1_i1.p2  ORF type:complete len:219 (+),score=44.62 TRINITY_DN9104_c0_g1_i1:44-658(+)